MSTYSKPVATALLTCALMVTMGACGTRIPTTAEPTGEEVTTTDDDAATDDATSTVGTEGNVDVVDLGPDNYDGGPFDPPIIHPETGEQLDPNEYNAMLEDMADDEPLVIDASELEVPINLEVEYDDYDSMSGLWRDADSGKLNDQVIRIDGTVREYRDHKYAIGAWGGNGRKNYACFTFVIDDATSDEYPKDGDRVVITGKMLRDKYGINHTLHTLKAYVVEPED